MLTAFYGFRRSEVLGIRWKSIDFVNDTLTIDNTITNMGGIIEKERTKNKASHRTMPLTNDVKNHLIQLMEHQENNKLLFGKEYINNDYVCKWEDGKPISPSYVSHKFKEIIDKNELEPITFHSLRHSCASILLAEGFDIKKIQEWLGHSSVSTTGNIYAHVQYSSKIEMGDALSSVINFT